MSDLNVIRAGIPAKDGCPVLTRLNAFIVQEGVSSTLEFVFRDNIGNPVDLRPVEQISETSQSASQSQSASESASLSAAADEADTVLVRVREFTGYGASDACHIWKMEGTITDAQNGTIRVALNTDMTGQSGLYTIEFAFIRGGCPVLIKKALLSIEPSLWGHGNKLDTHRTGCPTLSEVRMQMWDSSPAENVLLDDLEFGDEQILLALIKPIQYFAETNPPLTVQFNTTNFPYRSHWIEATIGWLCQFAAEFYRRNRLGGAAGGVNIDDLNKEREYMTKAKTALDDWKDFVIRKKVELNAKECVGELGSSYT